MAASINIPLSIVESGRNAKKSTIASVNALRVTQESSMKKYNSTIGSSKQLLIASPAVSPAPVILSTIANHVGKSFSHLQVKVPYNFTTNEDDSEAKEEQETMRPPIPGPSRIKPSNVLINDEDEERNSDDWSMLIIHGAKRKRKVVNYSESDDDSANHFPVYDS